MSAREFAGRLKYGEAVDLAEWIQDTLHNWDSPFVVIMRGISGSGKTTFVRDLIACLRRCDLGCGRVSADNFFEGANGYLFDASRLSDAHQSCRDAFVAAMEDVIVVDNTNICPWEYEFYTNVLDPSQLCYCFVNMDCEDEQVDMCYSRSLRAGRTIRYAQYRRKFRQYWAEDRPNGINIPFKE